MTNEQKNILSTIEQMTSAFHAQDIEVVMGTYEKNATVIFEPRQPISDSSILKKMFVGAFSLNPNFTYGEHEVFVSGDIALHLVPWKMSGTLPDGQSIAQGGLSVAVLRKQADGRWLMVIDNPHGLTSMEK